MPTKFIMISTMLCGAAMAGIRSGKATVAWIGESVTCEAGKPLQTAIRMVHDPGWHSYWINPGEAGVKTSVSWKLPPGWKTGGLGYPAPSRFTTSGLAGFGYEGTVLLPVKITPPEDFTGTARLTAVISWLACGEAGCVPGEAEIHLDLSAGIPKQTEEAREILAAHPPPCPAGDSARLAVTEKGKSLVLSINTAMDFDGCEFFPATPDVVDPRAPVRFVRNGGTWTAEVPKSAYASGPVKQLTLVVAPGGENEALELTWTAP
jgi:DsbC/DsbD-like thiol-disulfide interchange protein